MVPAYDPDAATNGQEQEAVVLQVAAPSAYRIVTFDLARIGMECIPPSTVPEEGEVLISAKRLSHKGKNAVLASAMWLEKQPENAANRLP